MTPMNNEGGKRNREVLSIDLGQLHALRGAEQHMPTENCIRAMTNRKEGDKSIREIMIFHFNTTEI